MIKYIINNIDNFVKSKNFNAKTHTTIRSAIFAVSAMKNTFYNFININKIWIIAFFFLINYQVINAYSIQNINNKIYINENGTALVYFDVDFQSNGQEILQIPISSDNIKMKTMLLDSEELNIPVKIENNGVFILSIPLDCTQGTHHLELIYIINNFINWQEAGPGEFKKYEFETYIENPFPTLIDTFSMSIILPEGWNYHKITGSEPIFKKKDPKPPFILSKSDGLSCVSIDRIPMEYRDKIGLEFTFKEEKKSYSIIFISAILIALYLFFFRNLVKNDNKKVKESNNSKVSKI